MWLLSQSIIDGRLSRQNPSHLLYYLYIYMYALTCTHSLIMITKSHFLSCLSFLSLTLSLSLSLSILFLIWCLEPKAPQQWILKLNLTVKPLFLPLI